MLNKETRAFNFEVRAEENEKHGKYIEGRAIVYGQTIDLGYFNEVIEAGALDGTDLRDVRLLVNHNTDMLPLARSRNNNENSTMQLIVDDQGMRIRANLDVDNNTEAKALYSAVTRGDVSGMSFMFTVEDEEWADVNTERPTRHIKKIERCLEVSVCTFPAYSETSIEGRSVSETAKALESVKATLESEKRKAEALNEAKAKYFSME